MIIHAKPLSDFTHAHSLSVSGRKSIFPISLGYGYRLNVEGNRLIIQKRGLVRFWKWKTIVDEPI